MLKKITTKSLRLLLNQIFQEDHLLLLSRREAELAYDEATSEPLSDEQINEMVRHATGGQNVR